jgi:hypothetical protein
MSVPRQFPPWHALCSTYGPRDTDEKAAMSKEHIPHVTPPCDKPVPPSLGRPDKPPREHPKDPPHAPRDPRSHPTRHCRPC